MQKYGFCSAKVWFLRCKSMVFVVQKYGVSWVYVCILQFVRRRRGPIYRARIYVNTHEMEGEMRVR